MSITVTKNAVTGEQQLVVENAMYFTYDELTELRKRAKVVKTLAELNPNRMLSEEVKNFLNHCSTRIIKDIDRMKTQKEKPDMLMFDGQAYQQYIENYINDPVHDVIIEAVAKAKRKQHNDAYRAKQKSVA